jgi:hypothetical protein
VNLLTSSDTEDTAVRTRKLERNTERTSRRRFARIGEADEIGEEGNK